MELLYCWCGRANDDSIENIGFNFGGPYTFSFEERKLRCSKNENYIENFFSKNNAITNITALVGRNGAGKTSALKAVLKCAFNTRNYDSEAPLVDAEDFDQEYVCCFLSDDEIYVFYTEGYKVDRELLETVGAKFQLIPVKWDRCDQSTPLSNTSAYYLSSIPFRGVSNDGFAMPWSKNVFAANLTPRIFDRDHFLDVLEMLHARQYLRDEVDGQNIRLPSEARVSIRRWPMEKYHQFFESEKSHLSFRTEFYKAVDLITPLPGGKRYATLMIEDEQNYPHLAIYSVYCNYLFSIYSTATEYNISENMTEAIRNIEVFNNPIDNVISVLKSLSGKFGDDHKANEKKLHDVLELIGFIRELYAESEMNKSITRIFNGGMENFILPIKHDDFSVSHLLEKYRSVFRWQNLDVNLHSMSHGEYAFLDLLTALHKAETKDFRKGLGDRVEEYVYLFIDEGDVFFHPQWEKRYVALLVEYAEALFKGRKVQIILTTNKPVILSDLPKNNVIFLEKDASNELTRVSDNDHRETFAQNIHTLYANSFFLEDGLIGEFAKRKIGTLVSEINAADTLEEFDRLSKLIASIGEDVLKRRLEELLKEKKLEKLGVSTLISELEQQLESLKEQQRREGSGSD